MSDRIKMNRLIEVKRETDKKKNRRKNFPNFGCQNHFIKVKREFQILYKHNERNICMIIWKFWFCTLVL